MNKIKLLLSFDYELPLGGIEKSYSHSLFEPAGKLLDMARQLEVPVNFFADILCLIRFKEWDHDNFFVPFRKQLHQALKEKHDVQLHIHPHWINSTFQDGHFIPSTSFTLSDFAGNPHPDNIDGIIEKGARFLTDICREAIPEYKCVAYRAGGYNLYPETAKILQSLYNNGIRIDSSVIKGYCFFSDVVKIDFRKMPGKPNWYMSLNGDFKKEADKGIFEIPIASIPKKIFEVPTRFKLKKYSGRCPENRGKMLHTSRHVSITDKIRQMLSSRMLTFDNYTYSPEYLMKILNYNIKKYSKYNDIVLSVISHPKTMGDYSFFLMKNFVEQAREKYKDNIEFCRYSEIYKTLNQ